MASHVIVLMLGVLAVVIFVVNARNICDICRISSGFPAWLAGWSLECNDRSINDGGIMALTMQCNTTVTYYNTMQYTSALEYKTILYFIIIALH